MRSILYYTEDFAIVDFGEEDTVDFELIKLLVELDAESPMHAGKIRSVIERDCAPVITLGEFKLEWLSTDIRANIDAKTLNALGYSVNDEAIVSTASIPDGRAIVAVADSTKLIDAEANSLQAIAKLFLLSKGNLNGADIIQEINENTPLGEVSMTVALPIDYKHFLEKYGLPTEVQFDIENSKENVSYASVSIPAQISPAVAGKLEVELPGSNYSETDILKCMVAGPLMSSLLNCRSTSPYQFDFDSLTLRRDRESTYTDKLAEAIMSDMVCACPHCGNPVLKLMKSSRPFCRPAHQGRYNEAAKHLLEMGVPKEEIIERFPFINEKTILNW